MAKFIAAAVCAFAHRIATGPGRPPCSARAMAQDLDVVGIGHISRCSRHELAPWPFPPPFPPSSSAILSGLESPPPLLFDAALGGLTLSAGPGLPRALCRHRPGLVAVWARTSWPCGRRLGFGLLLLGGGGLLLSSSRRRALCRRVRGLPASRWSDGNVWHRLENTLTLTEGEVPGGSCSTVPSISLELPARPGYVSAFSFTSSDT